MDAEKVRLEMRLLAEAQVDKIAGKDAILLNKRDTAKICGKSTTWVDIMIAMDRLPTVKVGRSKWVQRPALIEALVVGV